MGKLRTLQEKYKKGQITKAEYEAELKKLLEDEYIDQDLYDDALELDPEAEKPVFTQADVDRMVMSKAVKLVRKALKDAGVDVEADNKELLPKVAEMAKAGVGKDGKPTDDAEVQELRKKAGKVETLTAQNKDLATENAVLKAAGKYKPVNASQVVRALKADYMDYLDVDDDGKIDPKSVDRALKRVFDAEPNLFRTDDGDDGDGGQGGEFRGKGPGGGKGGQGAKEKEQEALKKEAKEMLQNLNILPKDNK